MALLALILLVFAFVLASVAAFWSPARPQLGWLSLAFFFAHLLVGKA